MHLRTNLARIRGERSVREIAEASGVHEATIRQIEQGKLVPRDHQVAPLELAYNARLHDWYSPSALLALQEGDQA